MYFDATNVAPAKPFDPVPTAWYDVMITGTEEKPTQSGDGRYLALELTIVAPEEFKGRKLFDRLNLRNPNPTAQKIAEETLSAICHAIGVIQVQQKEQLHDKPLQAKAVLKPAGPGGDGQYYEARNEVKGYRAAGPATATAATVVQNNALPPAQVAAAPAAGWTPPAQTATPTSLPPVAAPAPAPVPPAAPPVAPAFPPEGWAVHPQNPAYYYKGQEVVSEADLRARFAPVQPPAAPPVAPAGQPEWAAAPAQQAQSPAPAPAPTPAAAPAKVNADVPPWLQQQ